MRKRNYFKIGFLVLIMISIMYLSAVSEQNEEQQLVDGVYEASNNMLDVAVTIEEGKIADIKILEHRGGGEKYEEMIQPLLNTIIQEQSTQVDAVTGATVSSGALKEAIEEALEQARITPAEE